MATGESEIQTRVLASLCGSMGNRTRKLLNHLHHQNVATPLDSTLLSYNNQNNKVNHYHTSNKKNRCLSHNQETWRHFRRGGGVAVTRRILTWWGSNGSTPPTTKIRLDDEWRYSSCFCESASSLIKKNNQTKGRPPITHPGKHAPCGSLLWIQMLSSQFRHPPNLFVFLPSPQSPCKDRNQQAPQH